jgi:hypothetical protein
MALLGERGWWLGDNVQQRGPHTPNRSRCLPVHAYPALTARSQTYQLLLVLPRQRTLLVSVVMAVVTVLIPTLHIAQRCRSKAYTEPTPRTTHVEKRTRVRRSGMPPKARIASHTFHRNAPSATYAACSSCEQARNRRGDSSHHCAGNQIVVCGAVHSRIHGCQVRAAGIWCASRGTISASNPLPAIPSRATSYHFCACSCPVAVGPSLLFASFFKLAVVADLTLRLLHQSCHCQQRYLQLFK